MLVLTRILIQAHNVTKSPLPCFCHMVGAEGLRRRGAPAPRCGAGAPCELRCGNARAFPQLRSLSGSSPRTVRAKRKGPVAGAFNYLVGAEGLEPSILAARDFKSPAYANSATPPCVS